MGSVASQLSASAVLALGDNFYFDGIATDANNYRFENTWNSVYTHPSLQVPWYLLAGNHDHYGNVTAEVEHSTLSDRWNFPSLYHMQSFSAPDKSFSLDVIFIDTVDLAGNGVTQDESDARYYDKLSFRPRAAAATQWDWIEEKLAASTAEYVMVAGHYPVYSVCQHGPTDNLLVNLRPMLIKYGAHYMAGHDHCMMSSRDENNLMYLVTGTGNTCCTEASHVADVPPAYLEWYISKETKEKKMTGGFSSISATKESLKMTFYNQDGVDIYTTKGVSPRNLEGKSTNIK